MLLHHGTEAAVWARGGVMTTAATLFDLSNLEHRPGRYNQSDLRCPVCRRWVQELVLRGSGVFRCWRCARSERAAVGGDA